MSDMRETSGLYVETVEKKPGSAKSRVFHGDASKVSVQGAGLKKGYLGRNGTFNLELKEAGQSLLCLLMDILHLMRLNPLLLLLRHLSFLHLLIHLLQLLLLSLYTYASSILHLPPPPSIPSTESIPSLTLHLHLHLLLPQPPPHFHLLPPTPAIP